MLAETVVSDVAGVARRHHHHRQTYCHLAFAAPVTYVVEPLLLSKTKTKNTPTTPTCRAMHHPPNM
jgi:hypothetical protein